MLVEGSERTASMKVAMRLRGWFKSTGETATIVERPSDRLIIMTLTGTLRLFLAGLRASDV
ncbi:hypothetical protein NX02_p1255 (plasmid) [Sphingomonas sanxanigenens DSM 19645 = NX02]|uniref:Uncharacterized protein n=1 Tax=Sphingomonas sanxanigenens DSM 19645 = NX02 TaxID=1123269 RepID=A0A0F7JT85_9SPHN|nr:hypothetical protein NX02_p1255 [Sphingomonas sanxanigenens DSM 19645 = NX02]